MKCPECDYRIPDVEIVAAYAAIVTNRRKRRGTQMTSEQARQRQAKSVAARKAKSVAARKPPP